MKRAYYWLLWYLGFRDKDDNLTTPDDREKITFMLRRSQQRMKPVWAVADTSGPSCCSTP